jgi:hypothetical protein
MKGSIPILAFGDGNEVSGTQEGIVKEAKRRYNSFAE